MPQDMRPEDIRQLRKDTGLSRENFARLFSVSPVAITYWENGSRNPPAIYLAHLMTLRQKVDAMKKANEDDIGDTLLKLMVAGGIIAFFVWLFNSDNK